MEPAYKLLVERHDGGGSIVYSPDLEYLKRSIEAIDPDTIASLLLTNDLTDEVITRL